MASLSFSNRRDAWATYFDEHKIRVIFYSALQCAPTTKKTVNAADELDLDSLDDTERLLEEIKRNPSTYNDDNLEVAKSPNPLNRFDALQVEDDTDEKSPIELQINDDATSDHQSEDDDEEYEDVSGSGEGAGEEDFVETIREEILAYEPVQAAGVKNLSIVVNREELIYLLKRLYIHKTTVREDILTIGMVMQ